MPKKKQEWKIGDVFLVALKNNKFVVGQIVGREPKALNSVTCAFFDYCISNEDELDIEKLVDEKIFAILFVTRDLLDSGQWKVVTSKEVNVSKELIPFEDSRESGFVGAKIRGSGNVVKFLNAYYGLHPWDAWYQSDYLDDFLIDPAKKPKNLLFKS